MASRRDEQSRALGGVVVVAAILAVALFLFGLARESYWALAIPVAIVTLFVLGLVSWIGWTILTVQTEATGDALPAEGNPSAATTPLETEDSAQSQA